MKFPISFTFISRESDYDIHFVGRGRQGYVVGGTHRLAAFFYDAAHPLENFMKVVLSSVSI